MNITGKLGCCLALPSLSTPALADVRTAAFYGASDRPPTQASMFVGTTFRLGLDRKAGKPRYRAAVGISGMARNPGTSEIRVGQGLELSLDAGTRSALRMAGSDVGELWQSAKLGGAGKAALVVVGAAAVLGVAALVVVESARCEDEGNSCD